MALKFRLGSLKVIGNSTTGKLGYGFIFALNSNYGSNLHRLGDKATYWSKIAIFYTPLHSTPPLQLVGPRRNTAAMFSVEKLEWRGYLTVKKFEDMFSNVDRIPACNGRTDRQTDILQQPRYAYSLRGKNSRPNWKIYQFILMITKLHVENAFFFNWKQ